MKLSEIDRLKLKDGKMNEMPRHRNEHALALRMRAGNAGVAIAVDTRPKSISNKKKRNNRKKVKEKLRSKPLD
jgi:hypothetical protein